MDDLVELKDIVKKEYVENDETLCFETTPIGKIVYLSIVTFGFYDFILFYRYWHTLRDNFGYKINTFCRGILFASLFNFSLFPILDKYVRSFKVKSFHPILLASIYLFMLILGNISAKAYLKIPDVVEANKVFFNIIDFVVIFSFVIIVEIQKRINEVNKSYFPNAHVNKWSGINIFWAIIWTIFFIFSFISYFVD